MRIAEARKGAFKGGKKFSGKGPVVYNDSCYLGRYIVVGTDIKEPEFKHSKYKF